MGTLSHHEARARDFLHRADRAIPTHDPAIHDPAEAAAALRRAASHIITALAVHQGWKHKSQRQLETVLQVNISADNLNRSHLKTFRQAHTLSQQSPSAPLMASPSNHEPVESRTQAGSRHPTQSSHPVNPVHPCKTHLRRMRRRVASLINHIQLLIAGKPKPVRHHKRFLRQPDRPADPNFTSVQDILHLPNFEEIRQEFRLFSAPLAAEPDPHGWYERGDAPRRCQCHAHLWDKPQDPHRITLSPLWRRALEKTFRIQLPNPLHLSC